jgi:hypothetical protein
MPADGSGVLRHDGPIGGFTVTSAASVLIRRPLPRNLAIAIVTACPPHHQFEAMKALEPSMQPDVWLDMVLRCSANLPDSPMLLADGLRRVFPLFRSYQHLRGAALEWWSNVTHPLTIWRGCYEGVNEQGMCFSQSPRTASWYVRPGACGKARALLIEATAQDGDYIARMRSRTELEVLVLPERPMVVARHVLPLPDEFFTERYVPLREVRPVVVVPAAAPVETRKRRKRKAASP